MTDEQLIGEIDKHWKRFTETNLPEILDALKNEQWIEQQAQE